MMSGQKRGHNQTGQSIVSNRVQGEVVRGSNYPKLGFRGSETRKHDSTGIGKRMNDGVMDKQGNLSDGKVENL